MLNQFIDLYRKAYTGHSKQIWVMVLFTLINRMGTMVLPFLAVFLKTNQGFSLQDAGWIGGAFGIGSFAGAYLGGKMSDKIGPERVIVISLLVSGIFFISLLTASTFWEYFLLVMFTATFGEAYRPAIMVCAAKFSTPETTGRTMSFLRLAINVGMTISPLVAGIIVELQGYDLLFWIDGSTCIVASLFFLVASRNWPGVKKNSREEKPVDDAPFVPPYRNKRFMLYLAATFLMGFVFLQWFHTVPVFIKDVWGLGEGVIGGLLSLSSIMVTVIEMPFIHVVEKRGWKQVTGLVGVLLIGASYLAFLSSGSLYWCVLAIVIWTLGEITHLSLNSAKAIEISPVNQRGLYMSWFWMAWSLTHILCPIVGQNVAAYYGYNTLWISLFAIVIVSFLLNRLSMRQMKREID